MKSEMQRSYISCIFQRTSYVSSADEVYVFMWTLRLVGGWICTRLGELSFSSQRRREEPALQPSLRSPACAKQFVRALECLLLQFGLFGQVRALVFLNLALDNWTKNMFFDTIPRELRCGLFGATYPPRGNEYEKLEVAEKV